MTKIIRGSKWDFPVHKKPKIIPKPKIIAKRVVTRPDLLLIRKQGLPGVAKTVFRKKINLVYSVMPKHGVKIPIKVVSKFLAVLLLLTVGLQGIKYLSFANDSQKKILGIATDAYSELDSANTNLQSRNFADAANLFEVAQNSLNIATTELNHHKFLTWIVPQANSASHVLEGAKALSAGGEKLSEALELYNNLVVSSNGVEMENFSQTLAQSKNDLEQGLVLFKEADAHFEKADSLPESYTASISSARGQVNILIGILENLLSLEDLYLSVLGNEPKTYILIFQNYDEMRPTGGFIGTLGVLKIHDGAIKELRIESVYNFDGSLVSNVAAPGPFQPNIKEWGLRDANWFVDFPTSAKKILEFYEKGRETADGVIAFTPMIFEDILKITGAINMSQYDVVVNAENFQEVVQEKTSIDFDKELNQPKKFLADFAPILLNRLTNLGQENWMGLLQALNQSLMEKNVLLFSTDKHTQSKIEAKGFAGKILETPHDYLGIFHANLGGTKNDLEMQQSVELNSSIKPDGSIENHLVITRTNSSQEHNRDYMRTLVPVGSKLVSAIGFDPEPHFSSSAEGLATDPELGNWDRDKGGMLDQVFVREESGKTEFAGWLTVNSVTSRTVELTYTLPFKLDFGILGQSASYSLLYQKQPGVRSSQIKATWQFGNLDPIWNSSNINIIGNVAKFSSGQIIDEYWSILFSK